MDGKRVAIVLLAMIPATALLAQAIQAPSFDFSPYALKSDLATAQGIASSAQATAQAAVSAATAAQTSATSAGNAAAAAQTTANTANGLAQTAVQPATLNTAASTNLATMNATIAARSGVAAYTQTAYGPNTTGANTTTLFGGPAVYQFGSSGSLPLLRCDYIGQAYQGQLKGNYSLASLTPGAVTAIMQLGGTQRQTAQISNLLAGTPGAWWDAEMDLVCASASPASGTGSATVNVGVTIEFQAANGVTAALPVARSVGPLAVPTNNGAFTFDLQRTFTNAANTMQIETLTITWVR